MRHVKLLLQYYVVPLVTPLDALVAALPEEVKNEALRKAVQSVETAYSSLNNLPKGSFSMLTASGFP